MDRILVYPGSIPLDSDILNTNRETMVALGYLAQAVLGTNTVIDGLTCTPTVPASLTVAVGPGCIAQPSVVDTLAYGSLPADATSPLLKLGVNLSTSSFTLSAPTTSGQSVSYLIQAALLESDTDPIVLPYYNATNPMQPYSGPENSGIAQNTRRIQRVQLQLKAGAAADTGAQFTPPVDNGWVGLYVITVSYGQVSIGPANIARLPTAPFVNWKLPVLRPGFASGVQTFVGNGAFSVPAGVTQIEVEVWGGGSGSYASTPGFPSGGGSGGGYARKRVTGLVAGQAIPVTIGTGGSAGLAGLGNAASAGGTSSFGIYVSATGGSLNPLASVGDPRNGATPSGIGIGGDVNLAGSAGQAGVLNQGGLGGGSPMGGMQNSGTWGLQGTFPGGGGSGAGTGENSATAYSGAPGSSGMVVVRW